jgi:hypothetical protein
MIVTVSWKTEYRPSGWSFGRCDSCQQLGPVRIEQMVDVGYLWGLFRMQERPLYDSVARCDFCHRQVQPGQIFKEIDLKEWSPEEGVPALLAKLGVEEPKDLSQTNSNVRLHSLLSAVQEATSVNRLQLSPIGIVVGAIAGALGAIPLGMWLAEEKIVSIGRDGNGTVMVTSLLGVVVGLILGAMVETLLRRDHQPFAMLAETNAKYRLDLPRLQELSQTYSGRVRKAVKQLCTLAAS